MLNNVKLSFSPQSLLPWAAAFAVLLGIWFLPLPGALFGEEQLSAERMPETRRTANQAIGEFMSARQNYYDFITSHDMATISTTLRSALQATKQNPDDLKARASVLHWGIQVRDYAAALARYVEEGDQVFPVLQYYDSELMKYTRSLTPPTEEVRALTFPLADQMRLYPPPVGDLMPDPPWIKADAVKSQVESISAQLNDLQAGLASGQDAAQVKRTLDAIEGIVPQIWESGRSGEQVGLQHTKYIDHLQTYETRFQQYLDSRGPGSISPTRRAIALGANLVAGLVLAAGIAFLLMPRRGAEVQGAKI